MWDIDNDFREVDLDVMLIDPDLYDLGDVEDDD